MSSFICSVNHYRKVRQNCYDVLRYYKYKCCFVGLGYDTDDATIKRLVDESIYNLYKINIASVSYQYNETNIQAIKDLGLMIQEPLEDHVSEPNDTMIMGLRNALKCINYQIELDYNNEFLQGMINLINDVIVEKAEDYLYSNEEFNRWEYED